MSTLSKLDAPQVLRAVYDADTESLKVTLSAAQIELTNNQFLESRNAADDGDVELIKADASDNVQIGSVANASDVNIISDTNITGGLTVSGDTVMTGDLSVDDLTVTDDLNVTGDITCATIDPANGFTGSFQAFDGVATTVTVTITNGIITSVV